MHKILNICVVMHKTLYLFINIENIRINIHKSIAFFEKVCKIVYIEMKITIVI